MKKIATPQANIRYVNDNGALSEEGMQLLRLIVDALRELQDQVAAIDARVTELEP